MIKEIYVFVDKDGDIVEYYPSNSVIDDVYQYNFQSTNFWNYNHF